MARYQPMQPVETDDEGTLRFRENAIVRHLLDNGGLGLNDLARIKFPQEDRDLFAPLHMLTDFRMKSLSE